MGDISTRRGKVQASSTLDDGTQQIVALVPEVELQRYSVDLRSMTGGRGRFVAERHHYDVVPATLVAKVSAPTR